MTKKLVFIAIAAFGILLSGVAEAKVCRTGDKSCETFPWGGVDTCGKEFSVKNCAIPRAGSIFCEDEEGRKYKKQDCCSALGYSPCPADKALVGYGDKCVGTNNVEYYQGCGCSYGFAEVKGDGNGDYKEPELTDDVGNLIKNPDGSSVLYTARCGWDDSGNIYGDPDLNIECRLAQCNEVRHFFYESPGDWCLFREMTRCGGFGCMQAYDCDNSKNYYRNDSYYLDGSVEEDNDWERSGKGGYVNFIAHSTADKMSNELDDKGNRTLLTATGSTAYNLTNKIVCSYAGDPAVGAHDNRGWDKGYGYGCGATAPNYCYKFNGCNNVRRWYGASTNVGVLYDPSAYLKWLEYVEHDVSYPFSEVNTIYSPSYWRYHSAFLKNINPGYGVYTKINATDGKNGSTCSNGNGYCKNLASGTAIIYKANGDFDRYNEKEASHGCTYIKQNCHGKEDCYKKISCTEENRFYHSFINATELPLYNSSLNNPLYNVWYTGLKAKEIYPACKYQVNECNDATGCYRKVGCAENFEDLRDHPDIMEDWSDWFSEIRALCNDNSRCYQASSCELSVGSYSSVPNTSFFITAKSVATGSTCYRGSECYLAAGSYTSTPNTSFFVSIHSLATGSACYRGQECYLETGSYTSTPNTSFFVTINSLASGSTCYRGQNCYIPGGSYTSTPNTSFFVTINSKSSGSTCYRGQNCYLEGGSYTSTPNTSFFVTINSLSSGSTCYRGQNCYIPGGSYTSTPNTSFFVTINSKSSGSTCYRGQNCYLEDGAYTSTPNTSFFVMINSKSSGSTCYRGQECYIPGGSYSSVPNTSFFVTINSKSSGSTCYRGQECYIPGGAYTSTPNTSFFVMINSKSSGSTCYRGQECYIAGGSYSSVPNTSFFVTIKSLASGSTCYRGQNCYIAGGSYSSVPNTSFFVTINSKSSGSTCYRGQQCYAGGGSYTSTPNTVFFAVINSKASGSTCYRAQSCAATANANPNTSFFIFVNSQAAGSTCYRSSSCRFAVGAYSSVPNTSFFLTQTIQNATNDSTCYRGSDCNIAGGAYTSTPNTSFFHTISSKSSGSTVYRGQDVCLECGAYSSAPNTSFFRVISSKASGSTAYRGEESHIAAGAYSSTPNTSFFNVISSKASGSTSYRGESGYIVGGAYTSTPNTSFFIVISSSASGSTAYRGEKSHIAAGAYTSAPNTLFFNVISSKASGSTSYRGESVRTVIGAYTSTPNTSFFIVISSSASGSTSYRGEKSHLAAGAYTSAPNTLFFNVISSKASGSTSYRGESVNITIGAYSSTPNTAFFKVISSSASGSTCYRGEHCGPQAVSGKSETEQLNMHKKINTSFFMTTRSSASGSICYRGDSCHYAAGSYDNSPNTNYFITISSTSPSGKVSYRAEKCNFGVGAYTSIPNTLFFLTSKDTKSMSTCYRGAGCNTGAGAYVANLNTSYFITVSSSATGTTCWRPNGSTAASACRANAGAYVSSPSTAFFNVASDTKASITCWRATGCATTRGAYITTPNTLFFNVSNDTKSGSKCYRGTSCNTATGYNGIGFDTTYFAPTQSAASGLSNCYRADSCASGAYPASPTTDYFVTNKKTSLKPTTCWRATGCMSGLSSSATNNVECYFSNVRSSSASGLTCWRGWDCAYKTSYAPNTTYFVTTTRTRGQTCTIATDTKCKATDTAIFTYTAVPTRAHDQLIGNFSATGTRITVSACADLNAYYPTGCNSANGWYTTHPDDGVYFYYAHSSASGCGHSTINCYRATSCVVNQSIPCYFNITTKSAPNGTSCKRGTSCTYAAPSTTYFVTTTNTRGQTCTIATDTKCKATNTAVFTYTPVATKAHDQLTGNFSATGTRITVNACADLNAYYPSGCNGTTNHCLTKGNTTYFDTAYTSSSGCGQATVGCYKITQKTCAAGSWDLDIFTRAAIDKNCGVGGWKLTGCNTTKGWDTVYPDTNYFAAAGILTKTAEDCTHKVTCYKAQQCAISSTTSGIPCYFDRGSKTWTGGSPICYRGTSCTYAAPSTTYFNTTTANKGATCTIATDTKCKATNATVFTYTAVATKAHNTLTGNFSATGTSITVNACADLNAYYPTGCNSANGWYTTHPNDGVYFHYAHSSASGCGHSTVNCYKATSCVVKPTPGEIPCYFNKTTQTAPNGKSCARGTSCKYTNINETYFSTSSTTYGSECKYITSAKCNETRDAFTKSSYTATGGTNGGSSSCANVTATWATGCADGYSTTYPDDTYFKLNASDSIATGNNCSQGSFNCYRSTECNTSCDSNYFKDIKYTSHTGATCPTSGSCKNDNYYYGEKPKYCTINTAQGKSCGTNYRETCYPVNGCDEDAGSHNNSYEDPEVFTNTLSSQQVSCGSNTCTIDCSCNSSKGWYDTPSSYSARAASSYGAISKTSTYKYAKLGNQKKSCTHDCSCTPSSSTECPSGYSTGTTSCGSGKYYSSTSCTTTTTYACSPSGCSYGPTYSYPTGGKCSTCTYYTSTSKTTCPSGYSTSTTSCSSGNYLTQASSTTVSTKVRNYGTASECPTYDTTSTTANACGKCSTCTYYTSTSKTTCPSGYSTSTTSCSSGNYLTQASSTTVSTKVRNYGTASECPTYDATSTTANACGKCSTCTFYESNETCPDGYTLGKTSCGTGYDIKYADSTITNTRNYGTASECPTYTSTGTNRCGKCVQAGCPSDYFKIPANAFTSGPYAYLFNYEKHSSISDCYKINGCNTGRYDYSKFISNYTDYINVEIADCITNDAKETICCMAAKCKVSPSDLDANYFKGETKDIGDGLKCANITGCTHDRTDWAHTLCGDSKTANGYTCKYNRHGHVYVIQYLTLVGDNQPAGKTRIYGLAEAYGSTGGNITFWPEFEGGIIASQDPYWKYSENQLQFLGYHESNVISFPEAYMSKITMKVSTTAMATINRPQVGVCYTLNYTTDRNQTAIVYFVGQESIEYDSRTWRQDCNRSYSNGNNTCRNSNWTWTPLPR